MGGLLFILFFFFFCILGTPASKCQVSQLHVLKDYFITWDDFSINKSSSSSFDGGGPKGKRVIFVSKDGTGDSRKVQGAVDMVGDGNNERVKIFISPGIYREKVLIPATKPFISMIGNGSDSTVISWHSRALDRAHEGGGQLLGTLASASVAVESDYFCATELTFENTAPSAAPGARGMQAVALRLSGDKAMLYKCRIVGFQDTLYDHQGRHYLYHSQIQGSIDFIFGRARSLYQSCELIAVAASFGAIAASQRRSAAEKSGFSFTGCKVKGSGMVYLGRAWGKYARVVYSRCQIQEDIIINGGWNDWGDPSRRRTVWFGEFESRGVGSSSNSSARVPWARSLSYDQAKPFLDFNYIDGNQWLRL